MKTDIDQAITPTGGDDVATPATDTVVEVTQQPFKAYSTVDEWNAEAAKIRKAAERKVFEKMGIKGEEDIAKMRQAYDASLTQEERISKEMQELRAANEFTARERDELNYTVAALAKFAGKSPEDVSKIVKMAKGLVGEDMTIQQAIDEVFSMYSNTNAQKAAPATPKGIELQQPDEKVDFEKNPFKEDSYNLTEQMMLIKKDPARAKQLASAAGVVF